MMHPRPIPEGDASHPLGRSPLVRLVPGVGCSQSSRCPRSSRPSDPVNCACFTGKKSPKIRNNKPPPAPPNVVPTVPGPPSDGRGRALWKPKLKT